MVNLRFYFGMMLADLQGERLEVVLIPSQVESCARDGGKIRVAVSHNAEWYRELLKTNVRGRRKRKEKFTDSRINRREVERVLTLLSEGKETNSCLVEHLKREAEDLKNFYSEKEAENYFRYGSLEGENGG